MRLLFIRHGEPDYEHDSLTEKGDREAKLLAEMMAKENIDDIYVSPLGRAQRTASFTLEKLGKTAVTCDWLQEFPRMLDVNGSGILEKSYPNTRVKEDGTYEERILWDMLPRYLATEDNYLDNDCWDIAEVSRKVRLRNAYDQVTGELDALLETYGYRRNGHLYSVDKESKKTIAFFCHFGVTALLLSHIWNISPYIAWHSFCTLPTSVTELVTEEREKGIASFRTLRLGDISHLRVGGEEPSFMARFCEVYSDDTRH
jgi:probable phosphoglycerate mutase